MKTQRIGRPVTKGHIGNTSQVTNTKRTVRVWVLCDEDGVVEDVIGPEGIEIAVCRTGGGEQGSQRPRFQKFKTDGRDAGYLPFYPAPGQKWNAKERFKFRKKDWVA